MESRERRGRFDIARRGVGRGRWFLIRNPNEDDEDDRGAVGLTGWQDVVSKHGIVFC